MPPEPTWPPPPGVPDPMTEYDARRTALIRDHTAGPPLSRLLLVRELHNATGMDLRRTMVVVNSFCDRHGLFPLRRGWRAWLPSLFSLVAFGASAALFISVSVFDARIASAPTRAVRHLLRSERIAVDEIVLVVMLVALVVHLATFRYTVGAPRREAEEARRKMMDLHPD